MVSFFTIENDVCCGFVVYGVYYVEVCCCSAAKSCPTLYDPMDCSMLHWVMLSTSHPLLPSFSFAFNLSQHQSFPMSRLLMSGGQNIGVLASVLAMNTQGWFPLGLIGLISFLSKRLSRVSWTVISWLFSTVLTSVCLCFLQFSFSCDWFLIS